MSADTIELESKVYLVVNLVGTTTMTINKLCKVNTNINLTSIIMPQLDLTSIVELEDV